MDPAPGGCLDFLTGAAIAVATLIVIGLLAFTV
jgi:hypothetical protein